MNNTIMVRKEVLEKLQSAQKRLSDINPNFKLYIFEGYRTLKIQKERFLKRLKVLSELEYYENPFDLYEKTHETVAVPSVAGHPSGGAIDIVIFNQQTNSFLDFGSPIYDYTTNKFRLDTLGLTNEQENNRQILREILLAENFAPFDGEYWHFSYGDREWAFYYQKPAAIFSNLQFKNYE